MEEESLVVDQHAGHCPPDPPHQRVHKWWQPCNEGGNRRRQKVQGKDRGRAGQSCESCICIPHRRLPRSDLHNLWKCKSFCLFPDLLKSTRLQSAAQNPCYVFMSELVALTKEAGREERMCLLKEREGKHVQGPRCSRMEI